jgi:hypothetical protein
MGRPLPPLEKPRSVEQPLHSLRAQPRTFRRIPSACAETIFRPSVAGMPGEFSMRLSPIQAAIEYRRLEAELARARRDGDGSRIGEALKTLTRFLEERYNVPN